MVATASTPRKKNSIRQKMGSNNTNDGKANKKEMSGGRGINTKRVFDPELIIPALSFRTKEIIESWWHRKSRGQFIDIVPRLEVGDKWATGDVEILESWREHFISLNIPFAVIQYRDGTVALWKER